MKATARIALLLLVGLSAAAYAQQSATADASKELALTSTAFGSGAAIPAQFTCKGADTSPALTWSGAPANVAGFAVIMDDPDAPAGTWVHWVLWNVPAKARSLPQGVPKREQLDDGSLQGQNSFKKAGYYGPCPPAGQTHRYYFRLYALDAKLNLPAGASRDQLDAAMKGHVLGQAEYMGTFHK